MFIVAKDETISRYHDTRSICDAIMCPYDVNVWDAKLKVRRVYIYIYIYICIIGVKESL